MRIIFATGNVHKLQEAREILGAGFELSSPSELGCREELPEHADSFRGNALEKAQHLWDRFRLPCFADDSGLEVDALGGAPGVRSARYAGPGRNDRDNLAKLMDALRDVPEADAAGRRLRTARFRCTVALIIDGEAAFFDGTSEGEIALEAVEGNGFGYDPVFRSAVYGRLFSELTPQEKNAVSHRGQALRQMADWLKSRSPR